VAESRTVRRLFAGPRLAAGAETYVDHVARVGPLPTRSGRTDLIGTLEAAGLLGRGGAGFPVGGKWRSVAERARGGGAVILVNGAEGEPLSQKDRVLMRLRPHLVLDGAELAAAAVGADEVVLYVGAAHSAAGLALEKAAAERLGAGRRRAAQGVGRRPSRSAPVPIHFAIAPHRYISGEESAAVHFVNEGDARPVTTPPRPYERGVGGRPTVVQNVESLAYAALIARYGDGWYREGGRGPTPGTALVTTSGIAPGPAVREVELGLTIGELATLADPTARREQFQAVLLGGYFGGWLDAGRAWNMTLDPTVLRERGFSFGCGVVSFLSTEACPVRTTARIADFMAGQSAAQCGPCVFGLRSIAEATVRLARLAAHRDDLANLNRWAGQVSNRGACRHPDGAVGLLTRGLEVFADEFDLHQRSRRCSRPEHAAFAGQVA
jgi:NADH:ubiquinone oxidoreductase subunit F (NADH-binding)